MIRERYFARVKIAFRPRFTRYFFFHPLLKVGLFKDCRATLTRQYEIPRKFFLTLLDFRVFILDLKIRLLFPDSPNFKLRPQSEVMAKNVTKNWSKFQIGDILLRVHFMYIKFQPRRTSLRVHSLSFFKIYDSQLNRIGDSYWKKWKTNIIAIGRIYF